MIQKVNVDTTVNPGDAPKGMLANWFYRAFGCSTATAEWLSTAVIALISSAISLAAGALGISIPVIS